MVKLDSRSRTGLKAVQAAVQEACREKTERDRKRGILNRPVRAMVAGIPNVGKSTFINSFAGRACAKTGNKPGVTKGAQWVRLNKQVELLDTPGILWPRFEDQEVGLKLALIGSIREEVLNTEELALELLKFLAQNYSGLLRERYGTEEEKEPVEQLCELAKKRGCLKKGGEPDMGKAAAVSAGGISFRQTGADHPGAAMTGGSDMFERRGEKPEFAEEEGKISPLKELPEYADLHWRRIGSDFPDHHLCGTEDPCERRILWRTPWITGIS